MASIYRNKGRTVWMMRYYVAGQPIRESTGETDRRKAQKVADAKETDKDRGLPVGRGVGKIRWEAAVAVYEAEYRNNAYRSLGDQQRRLRLHLTPVFAGWRLAAIDPPALAAYTQRRRDAGASVGTVNRELDILRRMFRLCVRGRLLLYQPHVPRLRERNARAGFFERATFESVRAHLPEALRPVVTFAYLTGWRINSEVLTRQWRHVDFDANEIRLDPGETKNGDARVFPLTAELRTVLLDQQTIRQAQLAAGHVCPWVFFRLVAHGERGPKMPKPIRRFSGAWHGACRRAGCPGRIPHDFRRTAVRNMVRRGVPERVAMQLAGHLTRSVFERYNIVSAGDLREAAGRLDGQLSEGVKTVTGTPTGTPAVVAGQMPIVSMKKLRKFGDQKRK